MFHIDGVDSLVRSIKKFAQLTKFRLRVKISLEAGLPEG